MNNFKILNSLNESSYFENCEEDYHNNYFIQYHKRDFLNEFKKHSNIKKQAGYSKLKGCDYISLILVIHNYGDGEFTGYSIRSTCLIDKDNKITDSNNNSDEYGEIGQNISTVYHQLPDGKIIEYILKESYKEEIEDIYKNIRKIRQFYELEKQLPDNKLQKKIVKI